MIRAVTNEVMSGKRKTSLTGGAGTIVLPVPGVVHDAVNTDGDLAHLHDERRQVEIEQQRHGDEQAA